MSSNTAQILFFADFSRSQFANSTYLESFSEVTSEVVAKMEIGAKIDGNAIMWGRMSVDLKRMLLREVYSRDKALVKPDSFEGYCSDWNRVHPFAQEILLELIYVMGSELVIKATIPTRCEDIAGGWRSAVMEQDKEKHLQLQREQEIEKAKINKENAA